MPVHQTLMHYQPLRARRERPRRNAGPWTWRMQDWTFIVVMFLCLSVAYNNSLFEEFLESQPTPRRTSHLEFQRIVRQPTLTVILVLVILVTLQRFGKIPTVAVLATYFIAHVIVEIVLLHKEGTGAFITSVWQDVATKTGPSFTLLDAQLGSMWAAFRARVGPSPIKDTMHWLGLKTPQEQGALVGFCARHLLTRLEYDRMTNHLVVVVVMAILLSAI